MKYYKVKPEADNKRRADGNIYVAIYDNVDDRYIGDIEIKA